MNNLSTAYLIDGFGDNIIDGETSVDDMQVKQRPDVSAVCQIHLDGLVAERRIGRCEKRNIWHGGEFFQEIATGIHDLLVEPV